MNAIPIPFDSHLAPHTEHEKAEKERALNSAYWCYFLAALTMAVSGLLVIQGITASEPGSTDRYTKIAAGILLVVLGGCAWDLAGQWKEFSRQLKLVGGAVFALQVVCMTLGIYSSATSAGKAADLSAATAQAILDQTKAVQENAKVVQADAAKQKASKYDWKRADGAKKSEKALDAVTASTAHINKLEKLQTTATSTPWVETLGTGWLLAFAFVFSLIFDGTHIMLMNVAGKLRKKAADGQPIESQILMLLRKMHAQPSPAQQENSGKKNSEKRDDEQSTDEREEETKAADKGTPQDAPAKEPSVEQQAPLPSWSARLESALKSWAPGWKRVALVPAAAGAAAGAQAQPPALPERPAISAQFAPKLPDNAAAPSAAPKAHFSGLAVRLDKAPEIVPNSARLEAPRSDTEHAAKPTSTSTSKPAAQAATHAANPGKTPEIVLKRERFEDENDSPAPTKEARKRAPKAADDTATLRVDTGVGEHDGYRYRRILAHVLSGLKPSIDSIRTADVAHCGAETAGRYQAEMLRVGVIEPKGNTYVLSAQYQKPGAAGATAKRKTGKGKPEQMSLV